MTGSILFVDDQPERCTHFREQLADLTATTPDLRVGQTEVVYAQCASEAIAALTQPDSDILVCVVDIDFSKLPLEKALMGPDARREGLDIAKRIRELRPDLPVFLFTLSESDVPLKDPRVHVVPFDSVVRRDVVSVVLSLLAQRQRDSSDARDEDLPPSLRHMPGTRALRRTARSELPILILGETGTGKSYLASWLHRASECRGRLEVVECTQWPSGSDPNFMAAALFGQVRGAFPNAIARTGACEAARDGTLFLDEIAELRPDLQAMLLRALKERKIRRLGESRDVDVAFRLIAATNKPLNELRPDLLYRISSGDPITLPPLRERPEDIAFLAERELAAINTTRAKRDQPRLWFDEDTLRGLEAHDWPGNAHELSRVIASAAVSAEEGGVIRPEHLALQRVRPTSHPLPPAEASSFVAKIGEPIDDVVERYLLACWMSVDHDAPRAADLARVSRSKMWRVLRRVGVRLLVGASESRPQGPLPDDSMKLLIEEARTYVRKLAKERVDVNAKAEELGLTPAKLEAVLSSSRSDTNQ